MDTNRERGLQVVSVRLLNEGPLIGSLNAPAALPDNEVSPTDPCQFLRSAKTDDRAAGTRGVDVRSLSR